MLLYTVAYDKRNASSVRQYVNIVQIALLTPQMDGFKHNKENVTQFIKLVIFKDNMFCNQFIC